MFCIRDMSSIFTLALYVKESGGPHIKDPQTVGTNDKSLTLGLSKMYFQSVLSK